MTVTLGAPSFGAHVPRVDEDAINLRGRPRELIAGLLCPALKADLIEATGLQRHRHAQRAIGPQVPPARHVAPDRRLGVLRGDHLVHHVRPGRVEGALDQLAGQRLVALEVQDGEAEHVGVVVEAIAEVIRRERVRDLDADTRRSPTLFSYSARFNDAP